MWLLTARTASQYLLNQPIKDENNNMKLLINHSDIGRGDLNVVEVNNVSRNNIFFVSTNDSFYALKQPKNFSNDFTSSIRNEANFYHFIHNIEGITSHVGKLLNYDEEKSVLIFEADINFKNTERLELLNEKFIPTLLATISAIQSNVSFKRQYPNKYLPYYKPTLLRESERSKLLLKMKIFPNKTIRDLAGKIERVEENINKIEWETYDTIIHRDLKYQNCLLNKTGSEYKLKIIDWELAAIGDRDWDIAGFCYPLLKSSVSVGRPNHDFGLSILMSLELVKATLDEYSKINGQNFSIMKILKFCAVQIIENYIFCVLNNRFNTQVSFTEYARVNYFFELLEKDEPTFFNNYLDEQINRRIGDN